MMRAWADSTEARVRGREVLSMFGRKRWEGL